MRTAVLRQPTRQNVSNPISLPSPVGGWNARDNIAAMPPMDAVTLTNFVPTPTSCVLRHGHTRFATGFPGQVNTVAGWNGTSSQKLLAASGANIYDITAGGAVGAPVQTGLNSDKFQFATINNSAGNFLYFVNGVDAPRYFDGATWTLPALTGPASINALIGVTFHQNRMWFVEKDTLTLWYGATSAITGALTAFFLTGVARKGGSVMAIGTFTIDAGYGMNDQLVIITTQGEVIMYQGINPAVAADWQLVGVYEVGTPIGRRCTMKFRGDLLVITQDGVAPLAQAIQSTRLDPRVQVTNKIQFATSTAISTYGANFGWQLLQFPKENLLFLNVPIAVGSQQQQFVMNTITGSWCNFTGWQANCWELYRDDPYFGSNGYVGRAWNGLVDHVSNINAEGLQAFSYFGKSGILKRWTMMRPVFRSNGAPAVYGTVNVDFDTSMTSPPLSFFPLTGGVWDVALWDAGIWGGGLSVFAIWQGVNAIGYAGAPHIITSCQGVELEWVSTDLVMERGAVL